MKFDCPHCSQNLEIADEWAGHDVECPSCQQALTVPALAVAIPVHEAAPQPPAKTQSPTLRRPGSGASSSSRPPRREGGGFGKFLLTLIILAVLASATRWCISRSRRSRFGNGYLLVSKPTRSQRQRRHPPKLRRRNRSRHPSPHRFPLLNQLSRETQCRSNPLRRQLSIRCMADRAPAELAR